MKKLIYTLITLISNYSFSQLVTTMCDNVPYTATSTNYLNPINVNLPKDNPPYFTADYFKNKHNWNDPAGFQLTNMQFGNINLPAMMSLDNTQLGDYYNYIYYESPAHQHLNSEGWELLLINVGKYPDNIHPYTSVANKALPYIVLYNKYRSLIRVFVGMGPDCSVSTCPDALSVSLSFNTQVPNNVNGLLRLYEGNDQALDQKSDISSASTITKAVTEQVRWASADFQLAYDPCVCNFPSEIIVNFKHIKTQSLSLYGRSVGETDYDIMTNEMNANPKDFLSGFNSNNSATPEAGVLIEKYLNNTLEEYEERYKKYQDAQIAIQKKNKKVDDNLALIRFAKHAIATAQTIAGGFNSTMLTLILKNLGASQALDYLNTGNRSNTYTADELDWFKRTTNAVDGLIKKEGENYGKLDENVLFSKIKEILGSEASTFISNNFEKQAEPNAPSTPSNSVTYTEMKFGGTITTNADKIGPTFFVPGTFGNNRATKPNTTTLGPDDVFKYPIYNEPLGVFALLETPKIKISKTIVDQYNKRNNSWWKKFYGSLPEYYIHSELYQNWTVNYQFQLLNDLKFSFNNALDINKTNIKVAFKISARTNQKNISNTISYSYIDPTYTANVESTNSSLNEYEKIYGSSTIGFNEGSNHFYPPIITNGSGVNDIANEYKQTLNSFKDTIKLQTPFVSIDNINSLIGSIGIKNEEVRSENTQFLTTYRASTYPTYSTPQSNFNMAHNEPTLLDPSLFGYDLKDIKIELIVLVDVEYKSIGSTGKPNTTTISHTYPLDPGTFLTTDIYPNLKNSTKDYFQYPENITLNSTVFSGQNIDGCKLANSKYTCKSINEINIIGNLSTSNGYTVNIIAGNTVNALPTSIISPEISLYIEPVLIYSEPKFQVDQSYLSSFCAGTNTNLPNYRGRFASKSLQLILDKEEAIKVNQQNQDDFSWDFEMYPNPTNSTTNIQFKGNFDDLLEIHLVDITGKEVYSTTIKNEERSSIDVSQLNKGIYFLGVISNGVTKTKQLIIQ